MSTAMPIPIIKTPSRTTQGSVLEDTQDRSATESSGREETVVSWKDNVSKGNNESEVECSVEDKVIYPEDVPPSRLGLETRSKPLLSDLVSGCTVKQVSRMGERKVPLHVPEGSEERVRNVPMSTACLCKMKEETGPPPYCQQYNAWLKRKRAVQEKVMQCMTLPDLLYAHHNCIPGRVDIALYWNAVAARLVDKTPVLTVAAQDDSSNDSLSFDDLQIEPDRVG